MAMMIPLTIATATPLLIILVATLFQIGTSEMMMPENPDMDMMMPENPDMDMMMPEKPDMDMMMPEKPDMNMMMPGKPDMNMMMPGKPDMNMMMKPGNPMFVGMCKKIMSLDCGNRINIFIFGKGTTFPDRYCAELISGGKQCHDAIVKKHVTGKPLGFAMKALERSAWLWVHCSRVVAYQKRNGHH